MEAEQTPDPSSPGPAPIEFTGQAGEYFGIWLANVVLSIVTLGIFSAWAKVRRTRYFLGNTIVLGDRLEYHATGKMILKGRLIALAVIVVYSGLGAISPIAQIIGTIALIPLCPWVINRSLKFSSRMTSWRNVRFDWHGAYWGVVRIFFLWPIAALLTLGILAPMAARAGREYLANHYALGQTRFTAHTAIAPYYGAFLRAILFGIVTLAIVVGAFVVVVLGFGERSSMMEWAGMGGVSTLLPLAFVAWFGLVATYFRILARNIIVSVLVLGGAARFCSNISALRYQWIVLSNFAVTIGTAFLMYPWARVRSYRYKAECVTVEPTMSVASFVDTESRSAAAFGEEFGKMEGIEIGI
jgi:uncharacterized membrane protein YjgN (DUF898 family)